MLNSVYNWSGLVGDTPLIRLDRFFVGKDIDVYVKLEFLNLTGSVKDRIAIHMIRKAEEKGKLKKGMTLLVPTIGNTGISFSAIGRLMGYMVVVIIPSGMSRERFQLMKLFGAEFITVTGYETDAESALKYAYKIASSDKGKYCG